MIGHVDESVESVQSSSTRQWTLNFIILLCGLFFALIYEATMTYVAFNSVSSHLLSESVDDGHQLNMYDILFQYRNYHPCVIYNTLVSCAAQTWCKSRDSRISGRLRICADVLSIRKMSVLWRVELSIRFGTPSQLTSKSFHRNYPFPVRSIHDSAAGRGSTNYSFLFLL